MASIVLITLEVALNKPDICFNSNISPIEADILIAKSHTMHSNIIGIKIIPAASTPNAPTPDFKSFMQP